MNKELTADNKSLDEVVKECIKLVKKTEHLKRQLNNLWIVYIILKDHWLVRLGFKFGLIRRRKVL